MDAFDADVLIYAVTPDHTLGRRVRRLFAEAPGRHVGIGSVVLLPEVLAKPLRNGSTREIAELARLLSRLDLRSADPVIAEAATSLAAAHRLHAADAFHLATAVVAGADRFITNNRRDFGPSITEVDVVYPDAWTSRDAEPSIDVTSGWRTEPPMGAEQDRVAAHSPSCVRNAATSAARLEAASFWRMRATCCSTVFGEM